MKKVAVIGGGAAGMMAAITAGRCGAHVTVYERNERVGKKILVTGNGKCNFSNRSLGKEDYYGNRQKLERCFSIFSPEDAVDFFADAGEGEEGVFISLVGTGFYGVGLAAAGNGVCRGGCQGVGKGGGDCPG